MSVDKKRLRETVENAGIVAESYGVSVDYGTDIEDTVYLRKDQLYIRLYDLAAETADQLEFEVDSPIYDWRQAVGALESRKADQEASISEKSPGLPAKMHLRAIYGAIAQHEGLIDWSLVPDPRSPEGGKGVDPVMAGLSEDIDSEEFSYHGIIERIGENIEEKASASL